MLEKASQDIGERRTDSVINRRNYLKMASAAGASFGTGFGASVLGSEFTTPTRAATTVVDDFEDGDLSEYDFDRGSSGASVVSNPAYNGSGVLEISGTNTEMISTSGLSNYPSAGDTFSYWVRGTGGADDINLTYGVQDHTNRYFVRVDFANNDLILYRYEGGSSTNLDSSDPSLSEDTWYEVEVDWGSGGNHVVTLYDGSGSQLGQISASDSTWSDGGIGYDAYFGSSNGSAYFDYVTIKSGDDGSSGGSETPNGPDIPGGGLVVDNFEDGNLSEYDEVYGVNFSEEHTLHGNYSLSFPNAAGPRIYSTSGLQNYPSAGTTFSTWMKATKINGQMEFFYGFNNLNEFCGTRPSPSYCAVIDFENGATKLHKYTTEDGCNLITLGYTGSVNLTADEWYKVQVDWGRDGEHEVDIFDSSGDQVGSVSGTDSDYDVGGIGFFWPTDGHCYVDGLYITDKDDSGAGVVVEDFEDGDLSKFDFDRGSSGASIVSSPTLNGSNALEISGTNTEMIKTTGLPNEPEAGDVFSYWVRGTDGADMTNFRYGVQDHQNGYFVRVNIAEDRLKLYRLENGDAYLLADHATGFTLNEDRWYKVNVDWRTNGGHVITLYANSSRVEIESLDETWQSGGIGYDAYLGSGGTVYFDSTTKNDYTPCSANCVIDDFEDGNYSEYSFHNGNQGSASIVSRANNHPTYFGEYSLKMSNRNVDMISTSGLPNYPSAGVHFRYYLRPTNGAKEARVAYGVQDQDNKYQVVVNFENDGLVLQRKESGTVSELESNRTDCIISQDDWYRVEVDWRTNGVHTISLYNNSADMLLRLSSTDSTWSSGGIGYKGLLSEGGTIYFDSILVTGYQRRIKKNIEQHGKITDTTQNWHSDSGKKKICRDCPPP